MELNNKSVPSDQQGQPHDVRSVAERGLNSLPSELLEHILYDLPIRDLLLSQRVCRTWRSLISSSPTLQQALFLRPSPGPFEGWKITYTTAVTQNGGYPKVTFESKSNLAAISEGLARVENDPNAPLRGRVDEFGRDEVASFLVEGDTYSGIGGFDEGDDRPASQIYYAEKNYVHGTLNPLLFHQQPEEQTYFPEDESFSGFLSHASKFTLLEDVIIEDDDEQQEKEDFFKIRQQEGWRAFRHRLFDSDPTASWRRMYISQPPVRRLWLERPGIRVYSDGWQDICYQAKDSDSESPIKMGDLLDKIKWAQEIRPVWGLEGVLCPLPTHERLLARALKGDSELLAAMEARRSIEADT